MKVIFCRLCLYGLLAAGLISIREAACQNLAEKRMLNITTAQDTEKSNRARTALDRIAQMKRDMPDHRKKMSNDLLRLLDSRYLPLGTTRNSHIATMKRNFQLKVSDPDDDLPGETVFVYVSVVKGKNIYELDAWITEAADYDEMNNLVAGWVSVDRLEEISKLKSVESIRSVLKPAIRIGTALTQGDVIHRSDKVRSDYQQYGSGMKVGIISDGVDSRSSAQVTGDLPPDGVELTVLSNTVGGDEGTAMLEIVHDMVPDAALVFHDCGSNTIAFNTAIDNCITAGCDIICDDIGWIAQPFFEDGSVASHVASVLASHDIIYVSSAGNAGRKHYQGNYYPIPSSTGHDFSHGGGTGYYLYANLPPEATLTIILQWDDAFGSAVNDYDLLLQNIATGDVVDWSYNAQSDAANPYPDPLEAIQYTVPDTASTADYRIMVDKFSGGTAELEVFLYAGSDVLVYDNNIVPDDAIFGHPAVPGVVAVNAIDAADSGYDDVETFCSLGPVTIAHPSASIRDKPDLCGIDGVAVTGAGSFPSTFYGTSASAPHVAALAAQLWAQLPGNTGPQIVNKLIGTAVDIGASGYEHSSGWGRADIYTAFTTYVPDVFARLRSLFEGPYAGSGLMLLTLNSYGYIPLTSPYGSAPRSVAAVPSGVADWVLVELRSSATGIALASQSFFIQADGDIVDLDGSTTDLMLGGQDESDYYVVVKHRNHLNIMSANPLFLTGSSPTLYDFTSSEAQYFGTNPAVLLETGIWGMYGGDTNDSGIITNADKDSIINNLNKSGYYYSDVNMSGIVTNADKTNIIKNLNKASGVQ